MTPAIAMLKKLKIPFSLHEYHHDAGSPSYGLEAAEALDLPPGRVFKTLVVSLQAPRAQLAVAIVPVDRQLDLKAAASAGGVKKAMMADTQDAERSTGYVVGGISPLGQKRPLPTLLDRTAMQWPTIFVSGGKRGLEIEIAPADLQRLCKAQLAGLAR